MSMNEPCSTVCAGQAFLDVLSQFKRAKTTVGGPLITEENPLSTASQEAVGSQRIAK